MRLRSLPPPNNSKKGLLIIAAAAFLFALLTANYLLPANVTAFVGPATSAGVGGGTIRTDSSNNLGINASPDSLTKFLIKASSTSSSEYALRILQSDGATPLLIVRNDGKISVGGNVSSTVFAVGGDAWVDGTLIANAFSGNLTGSLSAGNISSGVFGSNQGDGNFATPASFGVATSSITSLPQTLSVYGGGYFSGNVGIGTTGPVEKLDVAGNIRYTGEILLVDPTNDDWAIGSDATATGLYFYNNTDGAYRMVIHDNGNVGIGTTGPGAKLEVKDGDVLLNKDTPSDLRLILDSFSNNYDDIISFRRAGLADTASITVEHNSGSATQNSMLFTVNGSNVIINQNGNVGIGTTGPGTNRLYVVASDGQGIRVASATDENLGIGLIKGTGDGASTTTYNGALESWYGIAFKSKTDGGVRYTFNTRTGETYIAGNVGIGTTNPTSALTVAGEIKSTSGGFRFPDDTVQATAASDTKGPLEIVRGSLSTEVSTASTAWTDISGNLNKSITVDSASNLVNVRAVLAVSVVLSSNDASGFFRLLRDGTTSLGIQRLAVAANGGGVTTARIDGVIVFDVWDTPGSGSHSYKLQMRSRVGDTVYVSRNNVEQTGPSTLTLEEYIP